MKVVVNQVRISFPNLFVPQKDDKGQDKYGAAFIIPKDHPDLKKVEECIKQVAAEKWADKAPGILTSLKASNKLCLHDGDAKAQYDGYAGNLYLSANNRARPVVLDRNKTPLTQQDGKPYSGCYVNVSLDVWAQDHAAHGKRINANVLAVQFAKDGEAFSGGAAFDDSDFETVEGDDDMFG